MSPKTIFLFLGESFSVLLSKFFGGLMCGKIFTYSGLFDAYARCQTQLGVYLFDGFRARHNDALASPVLYFVFSPC